MVDVRASYESLLARAGHDDGLHRGISRNVSGALGESFDGVAVEGIQFIRTIDGDLRDPIADFVQQVRVGHDAPFRSRGVLGEM